MKETKVVEEGGLKSYKTLDKQHLYKLDTQDIETYEKLSKEPVHYIYFEKDDEKDFFVPDGDGGITRIARCVNINGVSFRIPCQVKYPVPASIYEHLMQNAEDARRLRRVSPEPDKFVRLGHYQNGVIR